MIRRTPLVFTLGSLLVLSSWTAAPVRASNSSQEGVPALGHVFLIIGENTELGQINVSNSPYIIGKLMPRAAWLTDYFALTHFSEANYVGMMAGQFDSCQQFDGSAASCHRPWDNLFHQLDQAGITWQSWMESMPEPCYLTSTGSAKDQNHYGAKHNPAIFFDNIEGAGGTWSDTNKSAECLANDIPAGGTGPNDMSTFNDALQSGSVATFNLVVPNECEDAHDNCGPQGPSITQFNDFLRREIPKIKSSPAYSDDPNAAIIITFDEGTSNRGDGNGHQFAGGGNVMFAVVSHRATPGVYGGSFDHYSLLRTLEDAYGISSYLGGAATASPITGFWN
jgi:hypothetical protein